MNMIKDFSKLITGLSVILLLGSCAETSTDLPSSVMDVAGLEQFEGRIGWTPTYSSFYDFMTTMRLREGEDVAGEWLSDIQELIRCFH